ncbi:MAG TPA: hypothetical protein PLW83_08375, partial [Deltaproteobacteria bacterium]|nr:hypothetical protein [Deltaproteobacteria bacterium]
MEIRIITTAAAATRTTAGPFPGRRVHRPADSIAGRAPGINTAAATAKAFHLRDPVPKSPRKDLWSQFSSINVCPVPSS